MLLTAGAWPCRFLCISVKNSVIAEEDTTMNGSRRDFLKTSAIGAGLGLLGGAGLAGCATRVKGDFAPKSGQRVVVIGGGWGGATAARYVRLLDPKIEVILIEPNREFVS